MTDFIDFNEDSLQNEEESEDSLQNEEENILIQEFENKAKIYDKNKVNINDNKVKKERFCSECHQKGHSRNNKKFHPKNSNETTKENIKEKIREKINRNITREEAEQSANEWVGENDSIMRKWLISAIMDEKQHRDIGKVLASIVEIYVNEWISKTTGRKIKGVIGESYDSITDDDGKIVRSQIKFRMDAWHFETTRRNSKKNSDTNSTGHVAYKTGEFDALFIFRPGRTFGITGSVIRCLPVSVLINPDKKDQLVTNINSNIRKIYDCSQKTSEVLRMLYL